jgi:2-dehydropantoate 2-reductase
MSSAPMRVTIVGAGGIGGALGGRLALAGHRVTLIARGAHAAALRQGARLVDHVHGGEHRLALPVTDDLLAVGEQDLIILATKAHGIAEVLPRLRNMVGRHTVVVPAINGLPWWYFADLDDPFRSRRLNCLDPQGTMFADLHPKHLLGCVVHIAAEVRAPGEIHWTGGKRLILGELNNVVSERLEAVCAALDAAGFEAVRSSDIRRDVWWKLLGNLSFNPVAALTGYLMNQICADEGVLAPIRAMMLEGMAVSEHLGYRFDVTPDQRIDVARQLGAAKISMLQDLEARRRLELEAIVESVIELADAAGIAVPTIKQIHALARARAMTLGINQ